ncbi:4435_t:CDS:2, partial [Acaulospora colombiana]
MGGGGMKPIDSVGVAMLRKDLQKNLQKSNQPTRRANPMAARRPLAPVQPRPSVARPIDTCTKDWWRGQQVDRFPQLICKILIYTPELDDRIDEFAEMVRVHYQLEEIGDPASTSD